MPASSERPLASIESTDYGALFLNESSGSRAQLGKRWVEEAIRVLQHRLPRNQALRALPITEPQRKLLIKRSIDFLQVNQSSAFEEDNLKHVGRLISNMKVHAATLKTFLEMESEDVQLLAALHDLGKAKVPTEMLEYLTSVFGADDFLGLRVLPHELFSFYWIERLGSEVGISASVRQLLMDQVANHNLGPNLTDPHNRFLLAKDEQGRFRHWWVEHWAHWSKKANAAGLAVQPVYGHTISPLANTLVLFDRIDGGHPHSWEKFLNQDLISGHLEYSPQGIIDVMEHANQTAKEQLDAVGRQLQPHFTEAKRQTRLETFEPFALAVKMLAKNDDIVARLKKSNQTAERNRLHVGTPQSVLYETQAKRWFRFDIEKRPQIKGLVYEFQDHQWKSVKEGSNPVALLLDCVYADWK